MMKNKLKVLLCLTGSAMLITACQSQNANEKIEKKIDQKAPELGTPFSNGPKAPPTVATPTIPLPQTSEPTETSAAQVVTEKENIKITLPAQSE